MMKIGLKRYLTKQLGYKEKRKNKTNAIEYETACNPYCTLAKNMN